MRLRDYIVKKSEANAPLGITNPTLKRIALRAKLSPHTLHSISLGRRFASLKTAGRISKACDGHVEIRELTNNEPKKRGPKARHGADSA